MRTTTAHHHRTAATLALLVIAGATLGVAGTRPAQAATAAAPATGTRYLDPVFTGVTKVSDVTYGAALDEDGHLEQLKLDVYTPTGDTATDRPVVIFVHGGGFVAGDKSSGASWAQFYAKRGYVAASINYRLRDPDNYFEFSDPDDPTAQSAVLDAQHDAQAAVRWFRANAADLGVDPQRIAMTGSSAGGVTTLMVGMNRGDTGASGSPGYSSHICLGIPLVGAGAPHLADPGDTPMVFFNGEADTRVPFVYAQATNDALVAAGVPTWFNHYPGVGHGLSPEVRADAEAKIPPILYQQVVQGDCAEATPAAGGAYHPVTPARLVDSRDGTGGFASPWPAATTRSVTVAGRGGLPTEGVAAAVLNVTATGASVPTHLTVWPDQALVPPPVASNLNVAPGRTVANLVTVPVGDTGAVKVANHAGDVHVVVDVVGWYGPSGGATGDGPATGAAPADVAGSRFHALEPTRITDTREPTSAPLAGAEVRTVPVAGHGGVPANGATAVVATVTGIAATADTHLSLWGPAVVPPGTSTVNLPAGATVANLTVAPLLPDGTIQIRNHAGTTHVAVDVVGWYGPGEGAGLAGVRPQRLLDSRIGLGATAALGPGTVRTLGVTGVGGVPAHPGRPVAAVVLNVTAVFPSAATHLTVWGEGDAPTASVLNAAAGQPAVAAQVVVPVGADGLVRIRNQAGSVHVVVDVVAWLG